MILHMLRMLLEDHGLDLGCGVYTGVTLNAEKIPNHVL